MPENYTDWIIMNFLFGFEKTATFDAGLNARHAPTEQGRLPRRQEVAALDAGFGFRTRGGQTRCITVTGDHSVPASLQARVGTMIGRPLRRQ